MTGRRTLLVVASILVAAIGTTLVWLYVQGADARAREAAQSSVALQQVIVATAAADVGALGAQAEPKAAQVPVDLVLDAVTAPADVAQERLTVAVVPGTILRRSMFTSETVTGVSPGLEAVSITITDPQRVPALLQKGDDVSIYAYGGGRPTELIVRHVTVQTLGPGPSQNPVAPTTVGFEANHDVVRRIVDLVASGRTPLLVINGKGAEPL